MISKYLILLTVLMTLTFGCKKSGDIVENKEETKQGGIKAQQVIDAKKPIADYGDSFFAATIGEPINLIPALSSDSASHQVAGYIYNGLLKYDKDLNLVGDLAKSWDVSDDNLTITFHLRDDVKWHDGKPFTANDVRFTYEFMISPDTPTSYDADLRKVKSLNVLDNHTVQITYDEIYSPALNSWGIWMMPEHLLKGVNPTKSVLQRKPIGTGPYMLESWSIGKSLRLVAFDDYFEGRPYLDSVEIRVIPDQATLFMELLNGTIDALPLSPMQATKQISNKKYTDQYSTYSYLDNSYTYIGYNLTKKPFDDVRVRQALSYATPKQEIIDGILFGKGIATSGPYKNGTYWYNDDVVKYDYNIEKAKALLAEVGFKPNKDGILERDGKKFQFEIVTNQGNSTRSQIAEVIQRAWREVGIVVNIRILEWATFMSETKKNNFDATILSWNIIQDPDIFDVWHSSTCNEKGLNFTCFKNAEVDRLLELGQKSFDPAIRKGYYDKIQEIMAIEQPYTFLYNSYANMALSNRFRGIEPAPAGILYNFNEWYVPKAEQKY